MEEDSNYFFYQNTKLTNETLQTSSYQRISFTEYITIYPYQVKLPTPFFTLIFIIAYSIVNCLNGFLSSGLDRIHVENLSLIPALLVTGRECR